jgi:tetratricopeptide (TPR) repeat protein
MSRRRPSAARPAATPIRAGAPGGARTGRRAHPLLAALALVALTLVAYRGALDGDFLWDDDDYVTENATLDDVAGLVRMWVVPGATPQYYPLTFTTLWVEHRVFGDAPFGYHVTNVLLHAANAVLAWLVLRRLRVPGAWVAAAIFALHPVHVESVAWITERKNVLSGVFSLGALLVALGAVGAHGDPMRPGRGRRAAVLALFVAALLAKTVACTLPVVLLLLVWWRRGRVTRDDVVATVPLCAVGAALALVTIWMEHTHVGARGALFDVSPLQRVLIAGRALWFYAATLAWPHPLSFVYPRWDVDPAVWWQWLFPLAAGALVVGLWTARNRIGRWPLAAALGFAVTLAPALGFVDVYPMRYTFVADHYQYLASLFLIAPLAALAARAAERTPVPAAALAAPLLLLLAFLTSERTAVFANQETLWRDVIARDPRGSMALVNLGMWLHRHERSAEAATALEEAVRRDPDDAEIHGDLGIVLVALGRADDARAHLERAAALAPESASAQNNLANVLAAAGRFDEAVAHYEEAVRIDPRYADALNNLANVLVRQGKAEQAIARYDAALAADPGYATAHANLSTVLASAGRADDAIEHLRTAVRLDPAMADAQRALAARLAARGEWDEAVAHLEAAARLRPGEVEAQYQLGAALMGAGRTDDAIAAYSRAHVLRPDASDLHNDLGIALAKRGDLTAAAAEFRKALDLEPAHAEARANLAAVTDARPTPTAAP